MEVAVGVVQRATVTNACCEAGPATCTRHASAAGGADEEVEDLGQVLNIDRQYRLDYQKDISSGSWVTAAVRDAYARIGADPSARRRGERGLALNYTPARLRSG